VALALTPVVSDNDYSRCDPPLPPTADASATAEYDDSSSLPPLAAHSSR